MLPRRPRPSDTEEDIVQLQGEFMRAHNLAESDPLKDVQEMEAKLSSPPPTQRQRAVYMQHKGLSESADSPWALEAGAVVGEVTERPGAHAACASTWLGSGDIQRRTGMPPLPPTDDYTENSQHANATSDRKARSIFLDECQIRELSEGGGRSLFARELLREHGVFDSDSASSSTRRDYGNQGDPRDLPALKREVDRENAEKLMTMTEEQILMEQRMMVEKMGSGTAPSSDTKTTMPLSSRIDPAIQKQLTQSQIGEIDEAIRYLELIDPPRSAAAENVAHGSSETFQADAGTTRCAVDTVSYDLASKCQSMLAGRKPAAALHRLFEAIEIEASASRGKESHYSLDRVRRTCTPGCKLPDEILNDLAVDCMRRIRAMFLKTELDGKPYLAEGVTPDCDPTWMVKPIFSALATVPKTSRRSSCTLDPDTPEFEHLLHTVTYTLAWLYLLHRYRPHYLATCAPVKAVYAVGATVLQLGHLIWSDVIVEQYMEHLLNDQILSRATCTCENPQTGAKCIKQILIGDEPVVQFGTVKACYESLLHWASNEVHTSGNATIAKWMLVPMLYGDQSLALCFWQHKDALSLITQDERVFEHLCAHKSWQRVWSDNVHVLLALAAAMAGGVCRSRTPALHAMARANIEHHLMLPKLDESAEHLHRMLRDLLHKHAAA